MTHSEKTLEQLDEQDWFAPDVATFGDRVAASREAAGMGQKALAKRLGVRLATLRAWENDTSEPRANRLSMLAGMLNVSMMWLINGEGEGLEGGTEPTVLPNDAAMLLAEMRQIRTEMSENVKQMARLEKRLRAMMMETAE